MDQELKQYILTTKQFQQGILHNMTINEDGHLELAYGEVFAACILNPIDAIKEDETWNSLYVEMQKSTDCVITTYAITENSLKKDIILEYLHNPDITISKKINYIKEQAIEVTNNQYGLLHSIKGRYLFLMLELKSAIWSKQLIKHIKLEFPFYSFSRYLPEIYQGNEFFERFLAIFQSVYMDMERQIDNLPRQMDVYAVNGEELKTISSWLGIDNTKGIWKEEQLRILIKNAVYFRQMKGTIKSIKEMVKLFIGEEPIIVEHNELLVIENETILTEYEKVLTDNPYQFCVIVPNMKINSDKEYAQLISIIEDVKPAQTEVNLVVLDNEINLNIHSYIGVNTYISGPEFAKLDEVSRLGMLIQLG